MSKKILFSQEFTNVVGIPPTNALTLQEDSEAVKRAVKESAPGSARYVRAESQEHLTVGVVDGSLGQWFHLGNFPVTSNFLQTAFEDTWVIAHQAKDLHFRHRPDPLAEGSSYPSAHAAEGEVLATVLLWLDSGREPQLMAISEDIRGSRLILQKHYPSDLRAGRKLGDWLVQRMRESKKFCHDFAAAQRELQPYIGRRD